MYIEFIRNLCCISENSEFYKNLQIFTKMQSENTAKNNQLLEKDKKLNKNSLFLSTKNFLNTVKLTFTEIIEYKRITIGVMLVAITSIARSKLLNFLYACNFLNIGLYNTLMAGITNFYIIGIALCILGGCHYFTNKFLKVADIINEKIKNKNK